MLATLKIILLIVRFELGVIVLLIIIFSISGIFDLKILAPDYINGQIGFDRYQSGVLSQRCHGVAHERLQNAQIWAPP